MRFDVRKMGVFVLLWVLMVPGLFALPTEKDQKDQGEFQIENIQVLMELEHIQVSFLVRDSAGDFIRDLSMEDFVILENGQPQNIAVLKEQEVPISAVVMLDTSWSIENYIDDALGTALDFFGGLELEQAAFVSFSRTPRVILDWKEKPASLSSYFANLKTDGQTALYDSVIWVTQNVLKERSGKKLIILITDGIDTMSKANFEDMISEARQGGITVYPIIYTNRFIQRYRKKLGKRESPIGRSVSREFHKFIVLQNRFVDQTMRFGGRTIFSHEFKDLKKIYTDIIREMKSHYVMFYPSGSEDGESAREVKMYTRRVPGKIFIEVSQ